MHNALIGVTATDEERWPYYKGMDRGHKGYSNIYEAFKKAPKLFAKFKNKFEEELEKQMNTSTSTTCFKCSCTNTPCIITREGHISLGGGSTTSSTGTKDDTAWKLVENGRGVHNLSIKTDSSNTAHQHFFPTEFNDSAEKMEKVGLYKEEKWTQKNDNKSEQTRIGCKWHLHCHGSHAGTRR
eukprot:8296669-Ditylum_brightwellii.AAC.1